LSLYSFFIIEISYYILFLNKIYICKNILKKIIINMKKLTIIMMMAFLATSCSELQTIAEQAMEEPQTITNSQIKDGLKQALQKGVDQQVSKLTKQNGFYKNDKVKILLPEELQKVDDGLRKIGMGNIADEGLKLINRAAEDAVKKATPIFIDAIKNMSITDAKNILTGSDDAATNFLKNNTSNKLYQEFYPVVESSFQDVGADQLWTSAINKYNKIPLQEKVDPDLSKYVTNQAMSGVFKMIAVEEKEIRNKLSSRTTDLLKRVFKLQDTK